MPHDDPDQQDGRPRILGVRFGANPNSSSLGVDVTFLLFGGVAATAAAMMLSAWLRGKKRRVEVVGQPDAQSAPPPPRGAEA